MNFLFLVCMLFWGFEPDGGGDLAKVKVTITNISKEDSNIMVAIYHRPEDFLTERRYLSKVVAVSKLDKTDVELLLPSGKYALAVFEDKNKNGKLDRNWFYYPTEPFGFSNNYQPTLRAPRWSDAAFEVSGEQSMVVELR